MLWELIQEIVKFSNKIIRRIPLLRGYDTLS
jgi:hypothetical protein